MSLIKWFYNGQVTDPRSAVLALSLFGLRANTDERTCIGPVTSPQSAVLALSQKRLRTCIGPVTGALSAVLVLSQKRLRTNTADREPETGPIQNHLINDNLTN